MTEHEESGESAVGWVRVKSQPPPLWKVPIALLRGFWLECIRLLVRERRARRSVVRRGSCGAREPEPVDGEGACLEHRITRGQSLGRNSTDNDLQVNKERDKAHHKSRCDYPSRPWLQAIGANHQEESCRRDGREVTED